MHQLKHTKNLVLYADDDPDDRELISTGFVPYAEFIDVETFENGSDLLSYINSLSPQNGIPCLIILDINMPLLNGLQTLKLIREQEGFESTPIVLFTTYASPADKQFIKKYGADLVLKPVDSLQFYTIIQEFITHCGNDLQHSPHST
jgi:CheY-like chemotaxis protein